MAELWTSGWLEATRHKVVSPASGQRPRKSLVLFQVQTRFYPGRSFYGKSFLLFFMKGIASP